MSNIRKGDSVIVISGSDKGKKGSVLKVFPRENRALVQGVNLVKRHQRQTQTQQAGIVTKESPIQLSNIAHVDPKSGKLSYRATIRNEGTSAPTGDGATGLAVTPDGKFVFVTLSSANAVAVFERTSLQRTTRP